MKRPASGERNLERIQRWREVCPEIVIRSTFIAGFPGETEAHFEETYQFLVDVEPSYLHVFTYSERPNTHALTLPGTVFHSARSDRSTRLHILSDKLKRRFYESHLNKTYSVLWEAGDGETGLAGFTENYIKVHAPYDPERIGTLASLALTDFDPSSCSFFEGQPKRVEELHDLLVLS
jgi:threonylcarbamoyladenosine tRNA methylthiotransferase MtaB